MSWAKITCANAPRQGATETAGAGRHGLRNALIPVLEDHRLQFSFLLAGSIINLNQVFYLPGPRTAGVFNLSSAAGSDRGESVVIAAGVFGLFW